VEVGGEGDGIMSGVNHVEAGPVNCWRTGYCRFAKDAAPKRSGKSLEMLDMGIVTCCFCKMFDMDEEMVELARVDASLLGGCGGDLSITSSVTDGA
jgi:hypothetical protein